MRCSIVLSCLLGLALVACSEDSGRGGDDDDDDTETSTGGTGTSTDTGTTATGTSSETSTETGTPTDTATMTMTSSDPFAAARQACIDKINQLRATKSLPPLGKWVAGESCADGQASSDEQSSTPHGAFGDCGEGGQNECLGGGPGGIEACLESMWAEKDQASCSGCDACMGALNPSCPNCDFFGRGPANEVCGHYVNMSALYNSEAACGFSSLGGWAVINFH